MNRLIYPALLGLALVGCSQATPETSTDTATQPVRNEATNGSLQPMPAAEPNAAPVVPVATATPVVQPPHDVIYQGELNLAVDDFNQATTTINHLLEQNQAYLSTAHETRANGQHRQEMMIKVPPAKFVALVTALGQLGQVENKDVSSADVTADILQTAASLTAKQAIAAKYQQQLAQTANKEEASRLKEQTHQLQLDLAADQMRLQQFGARSAWATLVLRYYQTLPATETEPSAPLPAFAPQFLLAFNRGWSVVMEIAVVLTNIWPLWLLGGVAAWGVRRWRLRHPTQV